MASQGACRRTDHSARFGVVSIVGRLQLPVADHYLVTCEIHWRLCRQNVAGADVLDRCRSGVGPRPFRAIGGDDASASPRKALSDLALARRTADGVAWPHADDADV